MTPFEKFFAEEFPRRLATVRGEPGLFSNGGRLEDASWDRKAAYLLWCSLAAAASRADALDLLDDDEDLIGGAPTAVPQQHEEDDADLIG